MARPRFGKNYCRGSCGDLLRPQSKGAPTFAKVWTNFSSKNCVAALGLAHEILFDLAALGSPSHGEPDVD